MDKKSYKVCFVCKGNACRSPFAECVTRTLLEREGIRGIEVFSLGTLEWGMNPREQMMMNVAKEMGYHLTGTTTYMTRERLLSADIIVGFDASHRNAITKEVDYSHWNRIVLFDKLAFGTDTYVEDPHYQTATVYRRVAKHIEEGCKRLVKKWAETPPKPKV